MNRSVYVWLVVVTLVFAAAIHPRIFGKDDLPNDPDASVIRARIASRYSEWENDRAEYLRRTLLMQRLHFSGFGYVPGSCSGDADLPKDDPRYDLTIVATEIGPFGIPIHQMNIVCGGRIPLRGAVFKPAAQIPSD